MKLTDKDADDLLIASGVLRTSGARGGHDLAERVAAIARRLRDAINDADKATPADPYAWQPWRGAIIEGRRWPIESDSLVDVQLRDGQMRRRVTVGQGTGAEDYWRYGYDDKPTALNDIVFWRRALPKEET